MGIIPGTYLKGCANVDTQVETEEGAQAIPPYE